MKTLGNILKAVRRKKLSDLAVPAVTVAFLCAMCVCCALKYTDETEGFVVEAKAKYSALLDGDVSFGSKVESFLPAIIETAEEASEEVPLKNSFIELHGLTQRVMGNRYVYDADSTNNVAKLSDGCLASCSSKPSGIEKNIESAMMSFTEFLESRDIPGMYVQLPYSADVDDPRIPAGVENYVNEDADRVVELFREFGWNTYDLRDEMRNSGREWSSFFFKTDHHWTPQTALWAGKKICEKLNADYGFGIDAEILSEDNFNKTLYEDWFLGSRGKRVGKYYTGVDDYTLLEPKFETDMEHYILRKTGTKGDREIYKSGTFSETMLFRNHLDERDYYRLNVHNTYSGGNYPLTIMLNKKLGGGKILIIRDSFSNPLAPFLSLAACRELYTLDVRYEGLPMLPTEYIDQIKPDLVILAFNAALSKDVFNSIK